MKRFLFLALTVVFAISLFIVPALGAESYSVVFDGCTINSTADFELPFGTYTVSMLNASGQPIFTSDVVDINSSSFTVKLYSNGIHAYTLWGGTGDGQSYFEIDRYNEDFPPVWADDYCITFTLVFESVDPGIVPDEPTGIDFFDDIGNFFRTAITWLANIASFIVTRPVFLVLLAMPVIGFAVGLFSRIKAL